MKGKGKAAPLIQQTADRTFCSCFKNGSSLRPKNFQTLFVKFARPSNSSLNADADSLHWPVTLPSPRQFLDPEFSEGSKHLRQHQQTQGNTSGPAQGRAASLRFRDVRVRDGRPLRPRRYGDDEWAGADAALSPVHSVFLVHSGVAGGGGADLGDSRRGRILPLGARGVWRLLGISGRLVELERFVPSGRHVRGSDR